MENKYYKYCLTTYQNEYSRCFDELKANHKNGSISEKLSEEFDREAQKSAIRIAITKALRKYPISDLETINKVISADQSWKKSSGHAFEEMVKELASLALYGTGVEILLQRDLNTLIKANELANEPRDISWLKEQIKANIFDLYGILTIDDKKYCFGCVQAKTSIRDRVTRDREPSIHAMQSFFWSVVFVLDGDFLRLPKFVSMINGGSEEFRENGWHGMYVLSVKETNQRIYPLGMDFEIFKNHALQAAEQWQKRRQWFDSKWIATEA